ncbi:MAG: hypothetical protein HC896_02830 [Bacteroidales bacterium]|nr:hypothetical protein [Bacteroidales bacterium]
MNKLFFIAHLLFVSLLSPCQEVLLEINNAKIDKDEFIRIYQKNNNPNSEIETKTVDEYLDLFINFKLKVMEAERLGLDTSQVFIDEFTKYRDQLANSYMVDETIEEELLREAYDRSKLEVSASHIMVQLPNAPTPADTLAAYKK